jgi:hypothetical protein
MSDHPLPWLSDNTLKCIINSEKQWVEKKISISQSESVALLGTERWSVLLQACNAKHAVLFTEQAGSEPPCEYVLCQTRFDQRLAMADDSVDLVLLPHVLEGLPDAKGLLTEAYRVLCAEGMIVVCGINPGSLWGLRRFLYPKAKAYHTYWLAELRQWLESQGAVFVASHRLFSHTGAGDGLTLGARLLRVAQNLMGRCLPCLAGAYILQMKKEVLGMTPLSVTFQQKKAGALSKGAVSSTMRREK